MNHSSPGMVAVLFVFLALLVNGKANGQSPIFSRPASSQSDSNCLFSTYGWQFLPNTLIYPAYLAGVRDSRLSGVFNHDKSLGWILDAKLGGYFPLLRKGSSTGPMPQGFQVDVDASAHLRLDMENDAELYSTDYRVGLPLTYGLGKWQFKTAVYHVSSHAGDEFLFRVWNQRYANRTPPANAGLGSFRRFYSRDAIVLGVAYRPIPEIRLYTEFDYDLRTGKKEDANDLLDIHLGAEYSAPFRPDKAITPFAAVHLTFYGERHNHTGLCLQTGLQARSTKNQLFRVGVQYYTGVPEQYQRFMHQEHKFGIGLWYDY